jgi:hypothetical protein
MSNNEIRLRKQLSSGRIKTYRNYSALMQRHKRDMMIKRAWNLLLYFFIVALLMAVAFLAVQYIKKEQMKRRQKTHEATLSVDQNRITFENSVG